MTSSAGPILRCVECGDHIQSLYRHHFVSCKCGNSSVDGGSAYTRVLFKTEPPKAVDVP